MDKITVREAQERIDKGEGYLHLKVLIGGHKKTFYPESVEEALKIKKEYNSPYTIWYNIKNTFLEVVRNDGEEITASNINLNSIERMFAVTDELVNDTIDKMEYQRMGKKMMICLITTKNGHEVIGQSGIVDHRYFNEEIGKQWALLDAKNNLSRLLAYQVQQELFNHLNK